MAVEFILEFLATCQSENDVLTDYPGLTREDILACLSYKAFPIPAPARTSTGTSDVTSLRSVSLE